MQEATVFRENLKLQKVVVSSIKILPEWISSEKVLFSAHNGRTQGPSDARSPGSGTFGAGREIHCNYDHAKRAGIAAEEQKSASWDFLYF